MSRPHHRFALALAVLTAAGCGPIRGGVGNTTASATEPIPAATSTEFLWFPPTETPAVAAEVTLAPTPDQKPGVGELMVADEMTSAAHWNATASGQAAVTVSDRGLTISAQPGQPPVVSLHRSAIFDDMYIEVTARPSLCRERDAYGLVFRAPNEVAHYRFLGICNGTAAVERMSLGTPHVLQPPTASADVPVGAPGEVRLGVWLHGAEFRFFLNGNYQFTVEDKNYRSGGIGVVTQAGGATPVVVTFSDLAVYRLAAAEPAATQTP